MSETRNCFVCSKPFVIKTFDKDRAKYCSVRCCRTAQKAYDKNLPSRVTKTCLSCSKEFTVVRSQSMRIYCSRDCKKTHWSRNTFHRTGFKDLTGHTYGRLTVIEYAGRKDDSHNLWLCECSCKEKTRVVVRMNSLRKGTTRSCGCIGLRNDVQQPETYQCTLCKKTLPYTAEYFFKKPGFRWGISPQCIECFRPIYRRRHMAWRKKLKYDVLSHYSGGKPRCKCCGITGIEFLTLDHINGDGKEDRKKHGAGMAFYAKMKRLGYPNHLQVLCWNCNLSRVWTVDGQCPHTRQKASV